MKSKSYINQLRESKNRSERTFAEAVYSLAQSQGFYGRLIRDIESMDDSSFRELRTTLKEKDFKDTLDVVLWLEA